MITSNLPDNGFCNRYAKRGNQVITGTLVRELIRNVANQDSKYR